MGAAVTVCTAVVQYNFTYFFDNINFAVVAEETKPTGKNSFKSLLAMHASSKSRVCFGRLLNDSRDLVQQIDQTTIIQIFHTISELDKLAGMFDPGVMKMWVNNTTNLVASMLIVQEGGRGHRFLNIEKIRDQYLSTARGHQMDVLNAAFRLIIARVKASRTTDMANVMQSPIVLELEESSLSPELFVVHNSSAILSTLPATNLKSALKSQSSSGKHFQAPIDLAGEVKSVTWSGLGLIDEDRAGGSKALYLRHHKMRTGRHNNVQRVKCKRSGGGNNTGVHTASNKRTKFK